MLRWLLVGVVLLALGGAAAHAQTPPLSIKQVNDEGGTLTVVASVLDATGRPVSGIPAGAVELRLDGAVVPVQELRYGADPQIGLALVLAIDVSGSMAGERLIRARTAAAAFLDTLEPADQVALLVFNQDVAFFSDFTTDRAALKQTILGLSASGYTALYRATADAVAKAGSAPLPRRAVVLVSDGENHDPAGWVTRENAIDATRKSGVPVYSIGLGAEADRAYLDELAQVSRGQTRHAPAPADMDRLYKDIGNALRGQYVLRAQPGPVKAAPTHTVRLTVNVNGAPATDEFTFAGAGLAVLPEQAAQPAPAPAPAAEPVAVTTAPDEPVAEPDEGGQGGLLLRAGLLALAGGALAFWLVRRRRRAADRAPTFAQVIRHRGQVAEMAEAAPAPEPPAPAAPVPSAPGAALIPPAPAVLHVRGGPIAGLQVPVAGEPVTIGTAPECRVVLPAEGGEVERRHARIWHRDGRYMLHRLARHGAITMGGQQVQWAVLEPGDEFAIGSHWFQFQVNGGVA